MSTQSTTKDHSEKLTKHGKKPIIVEVDEEDKPAPHVPKASEVEYGRENRDKRKGAPQPKRASILRKRPLESGPMPKRMRRVSAHEI